MTAARSFISTLLHRLRRDDRGAGLVEYSLLLALIAVVCIGAVAFFGQGSGNSVNTSKACIEAAYNNQPVPANCNAD